MLQMYCEQVLGYDMAEWTLKANIFCLETTGENRARCIPISQGYIDMGKDEFKELICRIAYHETYGYNSNFPG